MNTATTWAAALALALLISAAPALLDGPTELEAAQAVAEEAQAAPEYVAAEAHSTRARAQSEHQITVAQALQ